MPLQLVILLPFLSTVSLAKNTLAPVNLYQDLGTFYCGTKKHTCEHYSEDSVFLTVTKSGIELARNFHESEIPLTLGFSGKLAGTSTKVKLKVDKAVADRHIQTEAARSPRQAMDENAKGETQLQLYCDVSRKNCKVFLKGDVTSKGKQVDWMSRVELSCNRNQLKDETLPPKEFEKACADEE